MTGAPLIRHAETVRCAQIVSDGQTRERHPVSIAYSSGDSRLLRPARLDTSLSEVRPCR